MRTFLLALLLSLPVLLSAQALNPNSVVELGSSANDLTEAIAYDKASGHTYIVVRTLGSDGDVTNALGNWDAWVIKLDENYDTLWTKNYGGSNADLPRDAIVDSNGDLVIVGESSSEDGDLSENKGLSDGWIIKIAPDGSVIWSETFGGFNPDFFQAVTEHKGDGYVCVGRSGSIEGDLPLRNLNLEPGIAGWITQISTTGALLHSDAHVTSDNPDFIDEYTDVIAREDGYYTVGSTGDFAILETSQVWVSKFNNSLSETNSATFGGSQSDYGVTIHPVPNSTDVIITSRTSSIDGDMAGGYGFFDYWLGRVTPSAGSFNLLEANIIGGTEPDALEHANHDETGVYMIGMSRSTNGFRPNGDAANGNDAWLVATDFDLKVRFETSFGGTGSDYGTVLGFGDCGQLLMGVEMESIDGDASENQGGDDVWFGVLENSVSASFLTPDFQEGDNGELEITLAHPQLGDTLNVSLTASAGSAPGAEPNSDYPPLNATAQILPGETSTTLSFPTNTDGVIEGPENVLLTYTFGPMLGCAEDTGDLEVQLQEGPLSRNNLQIDGLRLLGPNPTPDVLQLSRTGHQPLQLELMDLQGRTLISSTWQGARTALDLGGYPAGVYLLMLKDGGRVSTYRVSKR